MATERAAGDAVSKPRIGEPAPLGWRRIGLLHETNQGKKVDHGPEREGCYWNCRPGCKPAAVYVMEPSNG